jgi:hypothetical protein
MSVDLFIAMWVYRPVPGVAARLVAAVKREARGWQPGVVGPK